MSSYIPRVNSISLSNYLGQQVLLVGEVISQNGDSATIRTCDNMDIHVILPSGEQFDKKYAQVIGKVDNPRSVVVIQIICSSDTFDMDNYNKALELANGKYKELFV